MSNILFLLDFEPGHVLPTFGLARSLAERQHRVRFLGIADLEESVRQQGFEFEAILDEIYPTGDLARRRTALLTAQSQTAADPLPVPEDHLGAILEGALDPHLEPPLDLLIASYFLPLEILLLTYKYDLPMAIFTPWLRPPEGAPAQAAEQSLLNSSHAHEFLDLALSQGRPIRNFAQLVEPLTVIPELLACPAEFDLPGIDRGPQVRYLGPMIRNSEATDLAIPTLDLTPFQKLIFVSLGSQAATYRQRTSELFEAVFELARRQPRNDRHYLIAVGPEIDLGRFGEPPSRVTVTAWVPQLAVLRRASLMICHGGLGTLKECIYSGVPMIVLPQDRDQPMNAERVAHHRLGLQLDPGQLSLELLEAAIDEVLASSEIDAAMQEMSTLFRTRQDGRVGVEAVEELLPVTC